MRAIGSRSHLGLGLLGVVLTAASMAGCSSAPSVAPKQSNTTTTHSQAAPTVPTRLAAIAFFDPTHGYGVFSSQGPSSCRDQVGYTDDGGATFAPLGSPDSWPCTDSAPVSSLAFDDHGDGFLYGPDLYVTHDDGTTWSMSAQPGAVLSIEALGTSVWMVESDCSHASGSSACPLQLLESTDGGRTWTAAPLPPDATTTVGATEESALGQTWLVRVSQTSAYVVSSPVPDQSGQPDTAPLWFTADGGASWSSRPASCGIEALSAVLSVAPDGTLFVVCASQPSAGSQPKSTVRSTDGGLTWTVQSACPSVPSSSMTSCGENPPSGGYLGAIDAVSADQVFLVGGRSSLLASHDGGVTWQTVQPLIGDTSDGTREVIFFTSSDGLVLGYNGNDDDRATLWNTTDGGTSWTSLVPKLG